MSHPPCLNPDTHKRTGIKCNMIDTWCVHRTIWGLVWKIANERFAGSEELTWHMTAHCDTGTDTPHLRLDSVAIHHHFLPVFATCTPPLPVLRLTRADLGIQAQADFRNVQTYKTQARIYETREKTKHAHYSIDFNLQTCKHNNNNNNKVNCMLRVHPFLTYMKGVVDFSPPPLTSQNEPRYPSVEE